MKNITGEKMTARKMCTAFGVRIPTAAPPPALGVKAEPAVALAPVAKRVEEDERRRDRGKEEGDKGEDAPAMLQRLPVSDSPHQRRQIYRFISL